MLKTSILNFMKRPFIRNVLVLTSGTAMAQVVTMLFTPLITRIYGPEAYGLMGIFSSMLQILSPISALAYPISMILPKNDENSKELGKISFQITIFNTLIVLLLLILFDDFIINIFNLYSVSSFVYLIPFIVLSAGSLQVIQQWLIRHNQFDVSARAHLIETTVVNAGKLGIGLIHPFASVLIFFTVFKQGIRAILMYLLSGKNNKKNVLFFNVVSKPEFELVKKHKDFPLYRAPGVLIESVSSNFPLLLLTGIFGPVAAGFYSIAKTVLGIPISLIGSSLGNVLYPKLSETANNDKNIAQLIFKSTLYLTIVAVIPFGLIILLGPWIFSFIFGSDWIIAGEYARWMAVWLYTDFINIPSIKSLPVLSEQRFLLIFMIFSLLFKILGLLAGFYFFESDIVAIALFSIVGALANLVLIGITYIKSRRFDIENTKSL